MSKRSIAIVLLIVLGFQAKAQVIDKDLLSIQRRMDNVLSFSAHVDLTVDVDFIQMPTKKAVVNYTKGKRLQIDAKDFMLLPKRGLDFSLSSLTASPYLTVDRGMERKQGSLCKVLNIIPTDPKADFSIATVWLDVPLQRMVASEVNTKNDGAYQIGLQYQQSKDILPQKVEVAFAVEQIKIPMNLVGRGVSIDKNKAKSAGTKTGKIFLLLQYKAIKMLR